MQGWTAERVNQLAPDAASAKAGQGLAVARHWVSAGVDSDALWGECQGSGTKPYQVRIDLAEPAFKCSCPSRKFPCKHALGLMLLFAGDGVSAGARPAWVEEWLAGRAARTEKQQQKDEAPAKPVDEVAQAKRKQNRLDRIDDGLAALKLWLHDLVRTGLAAVPARGYGFFDEQARRLIDAQAPGVARLIQKLGGLSSTGVGWQRPFLEQLGLIYLLVQGFERRHLLPEATQELMLNVIGVPRQQEDILALPPIIDRWQVIAQETATEDKLRVLRTWISGEKTGRRVQILAFAFGAQPMDMPLTPGVVFDGEICCYPGDPTRGLLKSKNDLVPLTAIRHAIDINTLADHYATERAANPWLEGFATALASVIPVYAESGWLLADPGGRSLQLIVDDETAWTLCAISGGNPIDAVVHYDGKSARPIAVIADGEYLQLRRRGEGAAA